MNTEYEASSFIYSTLVGLIIFLGIRFNFGPTSSVCPTIFIYIIITIISISHTHLNPGYIDKMMVPDFPKRKKNRFLENLDLTPHRLGDIHKGRMAKIRIFWPPSPCVRVKQYNFLTNNNRCPVFGDPPPPGRPDVLYVWPLNEIDHQKLWIFAKESMSKCS